MYGKFPFVPVEAIARTIDDDSKTGDGRLIGTSGLSSVSSFSPSGDPSGDENKVVAVEVAIDAEKDDL
jgi:hypothetical protein